MGKVQYGWPPHYVGLLKKVNNVGITKRSLSKLKGGQLYWTFPFSKGSMVDWLVCMCNLYVLYLTAGNTYWKERLSTVDLLINIGCFIKKRSMFKVWKATHLNELVQGGQLYWSFPSVRIPCSELDFAKYICE
jgi:hypothetical protein